MISHSAFLGSFPVLFFPGIVPLFSNSSSGLCAFSPAAVSRATGFGRETTLRQYPKELRIFVRPKRADVKSGLHFFIARIAFLREPVRIFVPALPKILQPCRRS